MLCRVDKGHVRGGNSHTCVEALPKGSTDGLQDDLCVHVSQVGFCRVGGILIGRRRQRCLPRPRCILARLPPTRQIHSDTLIMELQLASRASPLQTHA